jgi:hypothetical protein
MTVCQISLLNGGASREMFSFSFGGSSGNLLASGSNSQVMSIVVLQIRVVSVNSLNSSHINLVLAPALATL